jgi:hypothetical protein
MRLRPIGWAEQRPSFLFVELPMTPTNLFRHAENLKDEAALERTGLRR